MQKISPKTYLGVTIVLLIAALHIFGPARQLSGFWHDWYTSYFSDLALPFGFYFLLCLAEANVPQLRPWWLKAGLVFGAATTAEILQFFDVYALGITFDSLDIVAYAVGVLLASLVERGIFARWLPFWSE